MSTLYIDYTGTPPLCAECGQPFTLEEWDDRHTGAEDDGWPDLHSYCCSKHKKEDEVENLSAN